MKKLIILLITISFVIPMSSFAEEHVKMIRKDRVWVYYGEAADFRPDFYVRHYYRFGDEITVNNLTYTTFELYKSDYFKMGNCPANENDPDRVTLMREDAPRHYLREDEDGRVYVLGDQTDEYYKEQDCAYINFYPSKLPEEGYNKNYVDCLLYDFDIEDGTIAPFMEGCFFGTYQTDYFPSVTNSDELDERNVLVLYNCNSFINIQGENCEKLGIALNPSLHSINYNTFEEYQIPQFYIIEGIGITRNGNLACFDILFLACQAGTNGFRPEQYSYLEGIYTPEEEPIYIFDDYLIKRLASVNNIQDTNNENENNEIFDLFGNPVTNPLPGSIYIRDGNKFIAR